MGFRRAIMESIGNALLTLLSLITIGILFYISYGFHSSFQDETYGPYSMFVTILIMTGASIIFMSTILASISKIVADAVGFSFAKKDVQITNSGAKYLFVPNR